MTKKMMFTRICVVAMVAMMLFSVAAITASANNHKDTDYSYSLTGGDHYKTSFCIKEDNSSCYMYCKKSTGTYDACVYTGPKLGGCAIDASGGYHYRFKQGQKRFMYNYVNEMGYEVCAIFATTYNNGTVASGVWSPDSVWEAGVISASDYIKE